MHLEEVEGDLVDQDVDVIVNAWNRNFLPLVAVAPAGSIRRHQAPSRNGAVSQGDLARSAALGAAVLTSAGRLPHIRAGLSVICEAAVGEGLMDVNPVAGIRLRDRRGQTEDPWTYLEPDEQTALLRKTEVPDRLIIEIAMYTGIRPSSLARVRLEDVSVAGTDPRIVVRFGPKGGPTKNGRPYTVHLIPRAAKSVQSWLKLLSKYAPKNKAKMLLPTRDGSRRSTDHNRPFLDTWPHHLRAAGITCHVRWYDLRHTCASSLVSGWWTTERWTLDMVKVYLGHMSRLSTERPSGPGFATAVPRRAGR